MSHFADVIFLSEECFLVAYDEWMYCPDYEASAHEVLLVAEEVPGTPDRSTWMEDAVRKIYRWISDSEVSEEDLIGLSLTAWRNDRQPPVVVIGMRRKEQVRKFDLLKAFEGIERDRPEFLSSGPLVVKVKHVKQSNQQRAADVAHFHQRCHSKKSILTVGNPRSPVENLARALALSEAYMRKEESAERSKELVRLRSGNEMYLNEKGRELQFRVTRASGEDFVSAVRDFDNYYTRKFTITVFLGLDGRHVLYESWAPPVDGRPQIDIVTDGREFHVVKPRQEAFSCGLKWQYCRFCRVHYRSEAEHECLECCRHCRKIGVCIPVFGISCRACRRDFLSDSCFKRHLAKERSVKSTCETLKKCRMCLEWHSDEGGYKKHNCSQRFCQNCRAMRPASHTCHASRQSSHGGTPLESTAADNFDSTDRSRLDGRTSQRTEILQPVIASTSREDFGSAKRSRLDDHTSQRTEILPPVIASTSREDVNTFDSPEVGRETAYSTSGPATSSSSASTAAHSPDSAGRLPSFGRPTKISLPIKLEIPETISTFGPTGRSPTASNAVQQPDISSSPESGTGPRQKTSADPPHQQAPPAAGNRLPEGVQVRGGCQGAEAAGMEPDLPNEGGAMAPIRLSAFYFPQDGKIELYLPMITSDNSNNSNRKF